MAITQILLLPWMLVSDMDNDVKKSNEAKDLANNELGDLQSPVLNFAQGLGFVRDGPEGEEEQRDAVHRAYIVTS
ncbi:hypothetical protein E2562_030507 [Oryza meyeriana var. granulata]|uniref:Uncharacterized protein n=1 Tax=Oryza meyeriana var. granulata TaxID=110450 RepID=A0A6G1BMX5_9ORYZ|nr:hypothetical protein E2562_030507 [Oryza meyeriana var. granulata]